MLYLFSSSAVKQRRPMWLNAVWIKLYNIFSVHIFFPSHIKSIFYWNGHLTKKTTPMIPSCCAVIKPLVFIVLIERALVTEILSSPFYVSSPEDLLRIRTRMSLHLSVHTSSTHLECICIGCVHKCWRYSRWFEWRVGDGGANIAFW